MLRAFGPGIGGLVVVALWIFAVFDVISTDEILIRNLPKTMWLILVIFVPFVGPVAWFILGRPLYAGWQPGGGSGSGSRRVVGPEDRPDYGSPAARGPSATDLSRWEDDLARREEELRRRRDDDPPPG